MGRYISGDIERKLWFAVQSSDDADHFGYIGDYVYYNDPPGEEDEPYALAYSFNTEHLESINNGIQECLDALGEYKEKFDLYFGEHNGYTDENLAEKTGCGMEKVKELLQNYARLELGMEIKKCVEETGTCCFDAEL
jgi:hypothetical protein